MINEKLNKEAHEFSDLTKRVRDAKEKFSKADSELQSLQTQLRDSKVKLREFVGRNVPRRAVTIPGGIIVALEYVTNLQNDKDSYVNVSVYDVDGEDISV